MIEGLRDIIDAVLREQGLDRRVCYVDIEQGPTVEVECSDAPLAARLRDRLARHPAAHAVRVVELPRPGTAELARIDNAVADVRRHPRHQAEMVSQAIHGDSVQVLKAGGEWTLARLDDGYIGWIRNWHLQTWSRTDEVAFRRRVTHAVAASHAELRSAPNAAAALLASVVAGTAVVLSAPVARGWARVELAGGTEGYFRSREIRARDERKVTPARLAATGRRFLGIPYLWGGTTPNGFDCSGLVQRVFRLNGIVLPRDSDMQARIGPERRGGPENAAPGDLVFFGRGRDSITHVGLVLPDRTFLHAHGRVVVNSLDTTHSLYSPHLASIWQLTRSPLRQR
jgi:cell wall-associated NlpC family hydrolase